MSDSVDTGFAAQSSGMRRDGEAEGDQEPCTVFLLTPSKTIDPDKAGGREAEAGWQAWGGLEEGVVGRWVRNDKHKVCHTGGGGGGAQGVANGHS